MFKKQETEAMINEKIKTLENESFKMHGIITSERHIPTKDRLSANRAKVTQEVDVLKDKRHQLEETHYDGKLETLITENKTFIFFSAHSARILIDEHNEVEVTFAPCGHKHTFKIRDRLRNYTIQQSNKSLFDRWRRMMKENVVYSGGMNCQQCRKDKEKRFAKLRRRDNKPIGSLRWELRKLQ